MTPVSLEFAWLKSQGELVQSDLYLHLSKRLSEVPIKPEVSRFFTNSMKQKHEPPQGLTMNSYTVIFY